MDTITVQKVEKDSELAQKLLRFVADFSWEEVREHTLQTLQQWNFTDWEAVFAAVDDERVVGMVTLLKTDYYPLPEIFPWVSTLFVTEEYRGRRISQKLVAHAGAYAKELGFAQTYIPSTHIGLYEKYGYRYVRDIVNYGGETDRLYVRETTTAGDAF
jgi:GNAT superfamily N-acetyltransferase